MLSTHAVTIPDSGVPEVGYSAAARTQSITAALTRHAVTRANESALSFEVDSITFVNLELAVKRLSAHLLERVERGAQIALYLPNSPALVLFFLAGARAGCEVQVFDREWPEVTVNELLVKLSPSLLICENVVNKDQNSLILHSVFLPFSELADSVGALRTFKPLIEPPPTTPFYTGFTSGSSGPPKGFRRDHQSWLESFANDQHECPLYADDVIVAPGALSHSLFLYAVLRGLHAGVTVVFCRRFSARNITRVIRQQRATILYSVPAQIGTLIRSDGSQFDSVRRVFSSGAKWPSAWRCRFEQAFRNAELCEFYGASELSFVTISRSSESVPLTSVGRAFNGVNIQIRNAEGRRLPANKNGLVYVDSAMLFLGYAGDCDTAHDGQCKAMTVGDNGYVDEKGFLFLTGRADRMIVVAGKNVYPEEVENVLLTHTLIDYASVVARVDEKRGQRLIAVIKNGNQQYPSRVELIRFCQKSLPQYKVPKTFAICEEWPLTRSGKTETREIEKACRENNVVVLT